MIIGVDVDGVVVDTCNLWGKYLERICAKDLPNDQLLDYNLSNYFKKELNDLGEDGYEWWRQADLYDDLEPIEGAVEVLKELSERGHEIVFISAIKGNHTKSKYYFLERHFPFKNGYVATKEKGYVRVDVMIDDRVKNLQMFPNEVHKIWFNNMFRQDDIVSNKSLKCDLTTNWGHIYDNIIAEELKRG